MIEKISEIEKDTIRAFIDKYVEAEVDESNLSNRASIQKLLTPWEESKQKFLYEFLGENLILSKPVHVKKSMDELEGDFILESYTSPIERFKQEVANFFWHNCSQWDYDKVLYGLLVSDSFATNIVPQDIEITNPFTKEKIAFTKGMKLTKALGRIAKEFNLKGFEDFRIRQSQILNEKELVGDLCISIHPLDYMSMSINESRWSSCMNWDDGCYRAGTTEMMNSPMVVVAYLKSKNDMTIQKGLTWNNKKWRELFIVTPEFACGVKGYPYDNKELESMVLEWLSEISNGRYEPTIRQIKHGQLTVDERLYHFHFSTDLMYNDIHDNSNEPINIVIFKDGFKNHSNAFYIHYSGVDQCMWCGVPLSLRDENDLICDKCYYFSDRCYCCEESISSDNTYCVDDVHVCEHCYEHETYISPLTGTRHLKQNSVRLYVVDSCMNLEDPDKWNHYILIPLHFYLPYEKYFTKAVFNKYNDKLYVCKNDLTDEGRFVFNI